jgi:hypothetical protein
MSNEPLKPVIQVGPTCGIVALVMAHRLLGQEVAVADVLQKALELKISKQGEVFSGISFHN